MTYSLENGWLLRASCRTFFGKGAGEGPQLEEGGIGTETVLDPSLASSFFSSFFFLASAAKVRRCR